MANGTGQTLTISTNGGQVILGNVDNNDDDGDGTTANDSTLPGGITGEHLSELSIADAPILVNGNVLWFYPDGVSLGTSISGFGNLELAAPSSLLPTGTGSVTIGGNLILPSLTGFGGHLVIGGSIVPFVNDMSTIIPVMDPPLVPPPFDNSVTILATTLTVNSPLTLLPGGNLTLLATDTLNLNQDINLGIGPAGGRITLGVVNPVIGNGDIVIDGVGTRTISAGAGYFVNTGQFGNNGNATNLVVNFGGAAQILETLSTQPITLNPGSSIGSVDPPTLQFINVVNALGANQGYPVTPYDPLDPTDPNFTAALSTGLASAIIAAGGAFSSFDIFNATAQLIGLEELGFIDTGLFEQDLTLFGIIGYGIALALAQCEEIEGCAPNVTLEELESLIAQLEAHIEELEKRCDEGDEASCELLARYKDELEKFLSYQQQLKEYLATPEEEGLPEEEFGIEAPETNIETLTRMLDSVKARIQWLESLRTKPEDRAKLGESIGIELTLEVLEEIIEGAQSEADFIEKAIELLKQGTQAFDNPVFTAEARDYSGIQHFEFGPSILTIDSQQNMNEWVY